MTERSQNTQPILNERHMLWVRIVGGVVEVAPARATTAPPTSYYDDDPNVDGWVPITEESDPDGNYPEFEAEMRAFVQQ